jgi:hypothetical protein
VFVPEPKSANTQSTSSACFNGANSALTGGATWLTRYSQPVNGYPSR